MRKRLMFYLQFLFFAALLALFIYVALNFSGFKESISTYIGAYSYAAIFILSFLLDAIMQPLGPDIPIIAGILAGLDVYLVVFFAALASILASVCGYFFGRAYSDFGFKKVYGLKTYEKWHRRFDKYGNPIVAVAAVTPVPYVPICWMSGIFDMRLSRFFIFALIPRILRFVGVAYLVSLVY